MLILHGCYHWFGRQTAFRNDFCRHCDSLRLAVQMRTFDVLHVFWIPLLPIGVWRRWRCAVCGDPPHRNTRTRFGLKVAGALLAGFFFLGGWLVPIDPAEPRESWLLRALATLLLALALASILLHRPEPRLGTLLPFVQPYEGPDCPLCGGELVSMPARRCIRCGAEA